MQFDEALRYLLNLGHETLALKLGLRTTELLLHALDDPQTFFPRGGRGGANGRGSTAVVLAPTRGGAGGGSGLFTSPPPLIDVSAERELGGGTCREWGGGHQGPGPGTGPGAWRAGGGGKPPPFFEKKRALFPYLRWGGKRLGGFWRLAWVVAWIQLQLLWQKRLA